MTTTLPAGWKPISSAPKDGTEILAWRSDCGQFIASYTSADSFPMTQDEIDAYDEATLFAKDWFTQWPDATRLDGSEAPTLWQPLPAEPCQTCNDQGAVGNVLTAEPCPDCTPPASAQDAPITVSVDPDPRGVSVGVWQGSRCIYTGAHAVPVGVQDDALGSLYRDANEIIRFQAARDFLVTDGMPVFAAPAAGDARDAERYRWLREKSVVSMGYASFGLLSTHTRDSDFFSREEGIQALDAAIDAAIAAQQGKGGEA